MKKFIYNTDNLNSGNRKELHSLLFYPNAEELHEYVAAAIQDKNPDFKFFSSTGKKSIWEACNHIIRNFYDKKHDNGVIHIEYLHTALEEISIIIDRIKFFRGLGGTNMKSYSEKGITFKTIQEPNIIAYAILEKDFESMDNDPYETPGGYRAFKALAGSKVEISLLNDLKVCCRVNANCLVDHYNNNICGVSTGNGTTVYKPGERVETRSFTMGIEFLYKEWTKQNVPITVSIVDLNKIYSFIEEKYPMYYDTFFN